MVPSLHRLNSLVRFVAFLAGTIHITLPHRTEEAWIKGGKYGLIIAADTADVSEHGHRTEYPGDSNTVAIQIPLAEGTLFNHALLHQGPCTDLETTGI